MKTATTRASRVKTKSSSPEAQFFKDLSLRKDVTTSKDANTSKTIANRSKLSFKVKIISAAIAKTKFKLFNGVNRLIRSGHVNKMMSSIRLMSVIRPIIVAKYTFNGVPGYYILDGQNLFTALIKLNIDVPYIEMNVEDDRDLIYRMALLNNSSRAWKLWDYVNTWSYINPEYTKLQEYYESSTLELQHVACVLHGIKGMSSQINRLIRLGRFKIENQARAEKMISFMEDVFNNLPPLDRTIKKTFQSAYMAYLANNFSTYSHKRFKTYFQKNKKLISAANSDKTKIDLFFKNV